MRKISLNWLLCLLYAANVFSQENRVARYRALETQLFRQANALNFHVNSDSIDKSYAILGQVLELNTKHVGAYESMICIDYKRRNYKKAFETACRYISSVPDWGNSWAYLGITQRKAGDSASSIRSFLKALEKYRVEALEWKNNRNAVEIIQVKESVVKAFLHELGVSFIQSRKQPANSISSISIKELEDVEGFIEKFMSYNGIQFL